ncbi:MAG: hypothetical protein ACI8WB_001141, partial [Phenylobacterium sp.]
YESNAVMVQKMSAPNSYGIEGSQKLSYDINMLSLSPAQARKIVLLSQGVHTPGLFANSQNPRDAQQAVLNAIEHLGYVQIDSISVVERAHHHSLWSRVKHYQPQHLDQLQQQKQIFEYWSHAAAWLPMRDYRFSLPRKQAISSGEKHWFDKDLKLNREILQRIRTEGPLQAKDFEQRTDKNSGWWDWKPAKKALEQLFMEGELMIAKRQGFQKVYDLTERVLPADINTQTPSADEYHQHLISRFLTAHGIAKPEHMAYLLKGLKTPIKQQCEQMFANAQLIKIELNKQCYYALPQVSDLLSQSLSRSKVSILSPFDNLLIQRKRLNELFDFNYQIECYVPAVKRQYGYFSLPLLWGQRFAGRMDVKMDRKTGVLKLLHLHIETDKVEPFLQALQPTLAEFMAFNQAEQLQVERISSSIEAYSQSSVAGFRALLTG